jgi:hypothetical protein
VERGKMTGNSRRICHNQLGKKKEKTGTWEFLAHSHDSQAQESHDVGESGEFSVLEG